MPDNSTEIMLIDEQTLQDKIYVIRGQQVMLDYDLAAIYGYTTSRFNEQVSRNIDRFDSDFMFALTREEFQHLMSQNAISSWGGRRKLPNAFTEQGIYMLMTVLKGDLAIQQSKALIRLFKSMKDYLITPRGLSISQEDYHVLSERTALNSADIQDIKRKMDTMVTKAELSSIMKLFDAGVEHEEVLILDGQPFKADVAYQSIYGKAAHDIIVVDDYIGVKTLQHLTHAKENVILTIVSDNKARPPLRLTEYHDFQTENPNRYITFIESAGRIHDRYIILDSSSEEVKIFHCGASSKDAGKKITTITQLKDIAQFKTTIAELLAGRPLNLQ